MEFVEIKQEKPFIEIKLENKSYILPERENDWITKLIQLLKVEDFEIRFVTFNEAIDISRKRRVLNVCNNINDVIEVIVKNSDPAKIIVD
jgi:hypothetical protein